MRAKAICQLSNRKAAVNRKITHSPGVLAVASCSPFGVYERLRFREHELPWQSESAMSPQSPMSFIARSIPVPPCTCEINDSLQFERACSGRKRRPESHPFLPQIRREILDCTRIYRAL